MFFCGRRGINQQIPFGDDNKKSKDKGNNGNQQKIEAWRRELAGVGHLEFEEFCRVDIGALPPDAEVEVWAGGSA
jgi:hypothetical protein